MKLIILLGNTNSANGELSEIAKARCAVAISAIKNNSEYRVLPTGGFGDHFNTSNTAHWKHLTKYLMSQGISPDVMMVPQESSNTLEDALVARRISVLNKASAISVVTSEFHLERVRYIFERLFPDFHLEFLAAEDNYVRSKINELKTHELENLEKIKREWVITPLFDGGKFPSEVYTNAEKEHKHYDQISWIAMTGLLGLDGFLINHTHGLFSSNAFFIQKLAYFFTGSFLLLLLWMIYDRSAQTARAARRVLTLIEIGYGQRGFSSSYQSRHSIFFQSFRAVAAWILLFAILSLALALLI